jgi:hypothetical protein
METEKDDDFFRSPSFSYPTLAKGVRGDLNRTLPPSGVEPHGLKPVAPPQASSGGTLRSTPYYAPLELRRVPSSHSSTV